jgi:uncharacterized alkaline shock family protein YloU
VTEMVKNQERDDKIKISEEVIATIAGIAASEVENLASMSGGLVDGIAGMLGRKNLGKGIKVEVKEDLVAIELSIIMRYGCKIHEVSKNIQSKVREAVEGMTGMQVTAVNINVLGVSVGKDTAQVQVVDETQV